MSILRAWPPSRKKGPLSRNCGCGSSASCAEGEQLPDAELRLFGFTHPELGALLAELAPAGPSADVASIAGIDLGHARELAALVVEPRRATAGEASALTEILDSLA